MAIRKLSHYSVRTTALAQSVRFYTRVLGLREGWRPPFDFPGAWLYADGDGPDDAVVHLIGIDARAPQGLNAYLGERDAAALRGGAAVDHLAFSADDLEDTRTRLRGAGLPFRERTVPGLGLHQLFCEDPSGVVIELNFSASEAAPR